MFRVNDDVCLVQTVDFFTPVVDDPEAFGRIAAANALSDIYAMGGRPLTALSIAAFPEKDFPIEWSQAIVRGGQEKLREAGCVLLGGHSVRDPEIKFGYAITGLVDPKKLLTNAGGRAGDALVLTKPLGTGVIATALKAGQAPEQAVVAATQSMATLNRIPAAVALRFGAHAATDITGFGLVGHALGIARQSRISLEIEASSLPLLPHARELAERFQPRGLVANRRQFEGQIAYDRSLDAAATALLFDPQTSGGLFFLVPELALASVLAELPHAARVGRAVSAGEAAIRIL